MAVKRFDVGATVWCGSLTRKSDHTIRISIMKRKVIRHIENYLDKLGFRYALLRTDKIKAAQKSGDPLTMWSVAWKPENVFATEGEARLHVRKLLAAERARIDEITRQLGDLKVQTVHEFPA